MQTGSPLLLRRHNVVFEVRQLAHVTPTRLLPFVGCNMKSFMELTLVVNTQTYAATARGRLLRVLAGA